MSFSWLPHPQHTNSSRDQSSPPARSLWPTHDVYTPDAPLLPPSAPPPPLHIHTWCAPTASLCPPSSNVSTPGALPLPPTAPPLQRIHTWCPPRPPPTWCAPAAAALISASTMAAHTWATGSASGPAPGASMAEEQGLASERDWTRLNQAWGGGAWRRVRAAVRGGECAGR